MRLNEPLARVALTSALAAVLVIILVAGLWPFNPLPPNNVEWLKDKNGLRLGKNPIVVKPLAIPVYGHGLVFCQPRDVGRPGPCWTSKYVLLNLHARKS